MAEITILGAYGTKGENHETTSFALNETDVIDAGNLLKGLAKKCATLDTVWLTHSHLDHIADIAFVLDFYFEKRTKPLRIAGLPQTLSIIQKHFLNELIWPDFSKINLKNSTEVAVEYFPIEIGRRYGIGNDEYIEAFETNHSVPSCGYIVTKQERSIAITSDTYSCDSIWEVINARADITALIIECSFPSSYRHLAEISKHLTPELLDEELKKLHRDITIYVNHLKPNSEEVIKKEFQNIEKLKNAIILDDYDRISF